MTTDERLATFARDWRIFKSAQGRYWCAVYRHVIAAHDLLSGRERPDATVIADSAAELATKLDAQRPIVDDYKKRLELTRQFVEARRARAVA